MDLRPMSAICFGAIAAAVFSIVAMAGVQFWHLVGEPILHPLEIIGMSAAGGFAFGALYGWRL